MSDRWQNNPWTDTAIAKLRELWPDPKLSAAKIVMEILGVSRNAVIGKAMRLGLGPKPSHSPHTTTAHKSPRKPRPYKVKPINSFSQWVTTYPEKPVEPFVPRAADIPSRKLDLRELTDATCKWPAGDPLDGDPYTFCGHTAAPGKPYCAGHCQIAYHQKTERTPAQKANDARMADRGRAIIKTRAPQKYMVEEVA